MGGSYFILSLRAPDSVETKDTSLRYLLQIRHP